MKDFSIKDIDEYIDGHSGFINILHLDKTHTSLEVSRIHCQLQKMREMFNFAGFREDTQVDARKKCGFLRQIITRGSRLSSVSLSNYPQE